MVPSKLLSWSLLLLAPVVVLGTLFILLDTITGSSHKDSPLRVRRALFDVSASLGLVHDATAQASAGQTASVDVSVGITVFPLTAVDLLPSQPVVYSLFISNNSPVSQSGIIVSNVAPNEIVPQSIISTTNGSTILSLDSGSEDIFRWQIDNLEGNQHAVIYLIGRVKADLNESSILENVLEAVVVGESQPTDNRASLQSNLSVPQLSFESPQLSFTETPTQVNVTIVLDPINPYGSAVVDFESSTDFSASTVDLNTDFEMVSGTLAFEAAVQSTNTISVTLYDDYVDEDNESFHLLLSNPRGAALSDNNRVTITIEDDDDAGVTVLPPLISLAEGGATGQYELVLDTQPLAPVVVEVQSYPQILASPEAMTFTSQTWDIVQTVNVVAIDDTIAEGVHEGIISHSATSADAKYNELELPSITSGIVDNEQAAFDLVTTAMTVTEGVAGTDQRSTYKISLKAQPTEAVTVVIEAESPIVATPDTLLFTPQTWDEQQLVVLSATDDSEITESPRTITHSVISDDPAYSKVSIGDISVAYIDNDSPGVKLTVSEIITVSEGAEAVIYEIVLNTEPEETVTIELTTDLEQLDVSPTVLTFETSNWDQSQPITIVIVDDEESKETQIGLIEHNASSSDPVYAQLAPEKITIRILDNDNQLYLPYVQGAQIE